MKITYNHSVVALTLEGHHHPDDTCLLIFPIVIIVSPLKSPKSDDSLAALPALGQGAPWPTRVPARAGSQAISKDAAQRSRWTFYEVVII
jgi:hypothetical protein